MENEVYMYFQNEKYYLYGAGINAFGVVKYLGKDNIVAVIDTNEQKHGMDIDGIPIVGIDYYVEKNLGEKIVISTFQRSEEVEEYLDERKIENHLTAPYIQAGFPSIMEIIKYLIDNSIEEIIIADDNIISYLIAKYILSEKIPIKIGGVCSCNIIWNTIGLNKIDLNNISSNAYVFGIEELDIPRTDNRICVTQNLREKFWSTNYELLKFKDKYNGRRCFIIGNGPSLKMEDLDTLQKHNEICFASNKIYLAFEKTRWRPNYYMVCDFNVYRSCYDTITTMKDCTIFIENFYNQLEMKELNNAYKVNSIHQKTHFKFSEEIEKYVYSGLTVTYNLLQLAVYMGFKEIYLLGIDFSFSGMSEDKGNHFCEEYSKDTKMKGSFYRDESLSAYRAAEEMSYKRGIRIYNATRGGKLETFERVDFDEIFEK